MYCLFHTTLTGLTAIRCEAPANLASTMSRLQARYLRGLPHAKSSWPKHHVIHYVKLALVEEEDVTVEDENLNEMAKMTLQGEVDKILKGKVQLCGLRDIFHYQNKLCPRLIVVIGAPGKAICSSII